MIKRTHAIISFFAVILSLLIFLISIFYGNTLFSIIAFVLLAICAFAHIIITACPHCSATFQINPFEPECYCPRCGKRIGFE